MARPNERSLLEDRWTNPALIAPSASQWAKLTSAARELAVEEILDTLDVYREAMSEGMQHSLAKHGAFGDLRDHFARTGRKIFLATELAVLYPGEPVIVPDLLAILDVEPSLVPDSWVVMKEGRGVDLILEFRNLSRKHKDLSRNVKEYAGLRIREYFSFDCRSKHLHGFRLACPSAETYTPILPQHGNLLSQVLELELAVIDGRLRFLKDQAVIPGSGELVERLQRMTDQQQLRLEEINERFEAARRLLSDRILSRLAERGLPLSQAEQDRIRSCEDMVQLVSWLDRAATVPRGADIFAV